MAASGWWSSAAASAGWRAALALGRAGPRGHRARARPAPADRRRRGGVRRRAARRPAGPPDPRLPRPPPGRAAASASPTCSTTCCGRRAAPCCRTTPDLGDAQPGDEDLAVLIVRRTTFEWVLRQAVVAEPGVECAPASAWPGCVGRRAAAATAGRPSSTACGSRTGATCEADIVVAATGRRGAVPDWLGGARRRRPRDRPRERPDVPDPLVPAARRRRPSQLDPKLGGDLGFVKYLGVPGDGGTLSVTLAVRTDDTELRGRAVRPRPLRAGLPAAARPRPVLRRTARSSRSAACGPWAACSTASAASSTPTGADRARLPRHRRRPHLHQPALRPGLLAGRWCRPCCLADAVAAHPGDPARPGPAAYEAACAREVEPWFDLAVQTDRWAPTPRASGPAGTARRATTTATVPRRSAPGQGDGGAVRGRRHRPVIGRALARLWNLLDTPADLAAKPEVVARMAAVMADPDAYPPPPREGPTRARAARHARPTEEAASHA